MFTQRGKTKQKTKERQQFPTRKCALYCSPNSVKNILFEYLKQHYLQQTMSLRDKNEFSLTENLNKLFSFTKLIHLKERLRSGLTYLLGTLLL